MVVSSPGKVLRLCDGPQDGVVRVPAIPTMALVLRHRIMKEAPPLDVLKALVAG